MREYAVYAMTCCCYWPLYAIMFFIFITFLLESLNWTFFPHSNGFCSDINFNKRNALRTKRILYSWIIDIIGFQDICRVRNCLNEDKCLLLTWGFRIINYIKWLIPKVSTYGCIHFGVLLNELWHFSSNYRTTHTLSHSNFVLRLGILLSGRAFKVLRLSPSVPVQILSSVIHFSLRNSEDNIKILNYKLYYVNAIKMNSDSCHIIKVQCNCLQLNNYLSIILIR